MIHLDPLFRPRSLTIAALLAAFAAGPLLPQLTWPADTTHPSAQTGDSQ